MPITSFVPGAKLNIGDLQGRDIDYLVSEGYLKTLGQGQYEALRPYRFDQPHQLLPDKAPTTTYGLSDLGIDTSGISASFDINKWLTERVTGAEEAGVETREAIETGRISARGLITSQFEELVGRVRQQMKQEAGGITAIGARRAGLGASTTLQANLQLAQQAGQQRITDLGRQRDEALMREDIKAAAAVQASLDKEQSIINDLYKDAWSMNIDIFNIQNAMLDNQRAEVQMSWNIISKLPKGETWASPTGVTYTGISEEDIDPFFTGANVVSLMKEIPIGETTTIEDPNTGEIYEISGLGQPDISTSVIQSTDASGNVIITTINKDTGEIISQVDAGRIGKPSPAVAGYAPPTSYKEWTLAGGEEGTGMNFAEWLQRTSATWKSPVTGATFQSRLQAEINRINTGEYGTGPGIREQVIKALQNEFPDMDVASAVYTRLPEGFETGIEPSEKEDFDYARQIVELLLLVLLFLAPFHIRQY